MVYGIPINTAELLGMSATALVLVAEQRERPDGDHNRVLHEGTKYSTNLLVSRCRGDKRAGSGALMRMLGVFELEEAGVSRPSTFPGLLNDAAKKIPRRRPWFNPVCVLHLLTCHGTCRISRNGGGTLCICVEASVCVRHAVARSSECTYEGFLGSWRQFRRLTGEPGFG